MIFSTRALRWIARMTLYLVAAVVLVIAVRAFDSRSLPDLQPWHRLRLDSELRAKDADEVASLEAYLELENRLFAEAATALEATAGGAGALQFSRFNPRSESHPSRFPQNWNRTTEWRPAEVRGGAILFHGLTDSPYSLRNIAQLLEESGYYVVSIRLPGHGTHPGALVDVDHEDWLAAGRLGARHVRKEIGPDAPFFMVGYSMGGALAVEIALESLEDESIPRPDRLVLLSPAIGVSPAGVVGSWHKLFSWIPYFEKFRWFDVLPEYDPFKYNSFPKNAGRQMYVLSKRVAAGLERAFSSGLIERFPPTLTFQSVVDGTVSTAAVASHLYRVLPGREHELVLFDLNRMTMLNGFIAPELRSAVPDVLDGDDGSHRLTLLTNATGASWQVVAVEMGLGGVETGRRETGLSWPPSVYSLSHVAIPFRRDDPLYGDEVAADAPGSVRIGAWKPRGEKDLLTVSMSNVMRLRFNPFLPYVKERIRIWLDGVEH